MKYNPDGSFAPMTDKEVVHKVWMWSVIALLLIGLTSLIGWRVGWWFKEQNTNRQVNIDNINKGTQTAWHDQAMQGISDFNLLPATDTARRNALAAQVCDLIPRLTDHYRNPTIDQFEALECN